MRTFSRKQLVLGSVTIVTAIVLASCAVGETRPAVQVTDGSALLKGMVRNTEAVPTEYWFQYGLTDAYGSETPHGSVNVTDAGNFNPVEHRLTGLAEGTTYHYNLCSTGPGTQGLCGEDMTFTTSAGRDSVVGHGIVFSIPQLGYTIGADIDASSLADGSSPAGTVVSLPGVLYFRIEDSGVVTCLRVSGNRASIGYLVTPPDIVQPPIAPFPLLVYVEDNGPTGDRMQLAQPVNPQNPCPEPTADKFVGYTIGGFTGPATLESGDYVIHDHAAA